MATLRSYLNQAVSWTFYGVLLFMIAGAIKSNPAYKLPLGNLKNLITESNGDYTIPGSDLETLRNQLTPDVPVSFIMDERFGANMERERFFYDVQNFLAPALLNPAPAEPIAIFYCSTSDIAAYRLKETGYSWIHDLGEGKGIARKI